MPLKGQITLSSPKISVLASQMTQKAIKVSMTGMATIPHNRREGEVADTHGGVHVIFHLLMSFNLTLTYRRNYRNVFYMGKK
jgi:hypothetical protein